MNTFTAHGRIPRTRFASFRRIALAALIALFAPGSAWAVCTLLWGHSPTLVCLLHGELAKEGLVVDVNGRCFSVGYQDIGGGAKRALLQVRDPSGGLLCQKLYNALPNNAFYAGVWCPPAGANAFAVGTQWTGNSSNPDNLIVSKWNQGSGTPWTNPINVVSVMYTPAMLGLAGQEVWGCRVVKASVTDLFISGCTEYEIFVARISRSTLGLISSWGVGGVRSIGTFMPGGCPKHAMPGAFIDFNFYPQAFVEVSGLSVFLGGTLLNPIALDYDFFMTRIDANTGSINASFGVQMSRKLGDDYMKAMAVTPNGPMATGVFDPSGNPQMLLLVWHNDGSLHPPFFITAPTPSRGNDVEAYLGAGVVHVFVGGHDGTSGATWHYTYPTTYGSTVVLPTLWASGGVGPNPKPYGPSAGLTDQVFDIGLGSGSFAGYTFSAGAVVYGFNSYGQPLQCIDPLGNDSFSANPTPTAPADDRAVAVVYSGVGSGTVYTHGTVYDPGGTWLNCPNHWSARTSLYKP